MTKTTAGAKKILIGILGGIVLVTGIILVPLPGPGWLIVFAGLGILATEFEWARRLLGFAEQKYGQWERWLKRQNFIIKAAVIAATAVLVVFVLWLVNTFGVANKLLHLNQDWLKSPLF